jgi:hypothetical protein
VCLTTRKGIARSFTERSFPKSRRTPRKLIRIGPESTGLGITDCNQATSKENTYVLKAVPGRAFALDLTGAALSSCRFYRFTNAH